MLKLSTLLTLALIALQAQPAVEATIQSPAMLPAVSIVVKAPIGINSMIHQITVQRDQAVIKHTTDEPLMAFSNSVSGIDR